MNPLRCATLSVSDPAASAARYRHWFNYQVVSEGLISPQQAHAWAAPGMAGRVFSVVRPASGAKVDLRFVEGEAATLAAYQPLRSHGWAAIELCVQDVLAVHARMQRSPFDVIGPPSAIANLPSIHPMQVRGPDGEIIYLTQILQGGPGSGLPTALTLVDRLFIAVLACADMAASAQWFATQLGLTLEPELQIPYRMINHAFSLPSDRLHRLQTATHGGQVCLEFDQYPEAAVARATAHGELPPGVAMCSIVHPAIDTIPGPWHVPPAPCEDAVCEGRRAGLLRSPEGALIEVVDGATAAMEAGR